MNKPDFGQRALMGKEGQSKFLAFFCRFFGHKLVGVFTSSTDPDYKCTPYHYCERCNLQEITKEK
jgi:hypothetical protein